MKIYFASALRGVKKYSAVYKRAYEIIRELGHVNLSEILLDPNAESIYNGSLKQITQYYNDSMKAVKDCDICIVESSIQSMSMGYIMDRALESGKPLIVLHQSSNEPFFFSGIKNDKLHIWEYTIDDLKEVIGQAIEDAKEQMDVRFNFFVSPKIVNYLDWISRKKRMPRAVYLRRLIEKDMKVNTEYQKI